jgi:hypothetical protein
VIGGHFAYSLMALLRSLEAADTADSVAAKLRCIQARPLLAPACVHRPLYVVVSLVGGCN